MNNGDFNCIIEEQLEYCRQVLQTKANEYSDGLDRLHNFRIGASLQHIPMRQALAGMMVKHTTSLYDMCSTDPNVYDFTLWLEKITDHINYLLILRAVLIEEQEEEIKVISKALEREAR